MESDLRANDALVGCILLVIALAISFESCVKFFKRDEDVSLTTLHTPLLANSPLEHRPEAAVRDAEEGYNACAFCGFENFKRFPFCALCDSSIQTRAGDSKEDTGYRSEAMPMTTERQRRARVRKEWVRKLDVEQKVFWYRNGEHESSRRFPGYTLIFRKDHSIPRGRNVTERALQGEGTTEVVEKPKTTIEILPPEIPEIVPRGRVPSTQLVREDHPDTKPVALTKESVMQMLDSEVVALQVVLKESSVADPEELPVQDPDQRAVHWQYVLDLAALDFPKKYAHFVTTTAGMLVHADQQYITLSVLRDALLDDSMESLSIVPRPYIRAAMRIEFPGKRGVDAGGLQREWLAQLNQELSEPSNGVFRCVNMSEQTYYLNPNSAHDVGAKHLVYYFGAGRLVGRALLEGHVLGFHLALPLLKIILGIPLAFSDLEYFDPEAYRSMLWVKENDGVKTLGLDFSVMEKRGGELVVVDLIPNGRSIDVTDENKDLYLERRFQYLLFESVSSQLCVFLKGIYEVIPCELLMIFDPEEFDYVLCGSDEIDVDDWKRHSRCSPILLHHNVMTWFWELVREMPNEYRRRLLHFATGSSRVPIAGFSALMSNDGRLSPFTLHAERGSENEYIWSHACFNRLGLPLYASREKLETVLYATLDMELYGFTTD